MFYTDSAHIMLYSYYVIYRIYKEHSKLNSIKTNNPLRKWGKNMKRHFSAEDIQVANNHTKSCSTLLLEECKWKPQWAVTTTYHNDWKKEVVTVPNAGKYMEKHIHCWWKVKWYSNSRKTVGQLLKTLNPLQTKHPTLMLLEIYPS